MSDVKENYVDRAIDRAWDLLDRGEPEKALDLVATVDSNAPRRWVVEASAQLQLDDPAAARVAIDRAARSPAIENDADFLWNLAEVSLREWKLAEAEALYERVAAQERSAAALERLSLCADLRHDHATADRLLAEAESIAGDEAPHPPRLSPAQFEHVIDEAVELLPRQFQDALRETQILIEPVPTETLVDKNDCAETPPDMLGLFVGSNKLEESPDGPPALPPTIYLFQRNLERASIDRDELVNEIRVTLFHEIGHLLGFDEDGVDRMGLA